MDGDQDRDDGPPDLDALVAEIAAEIDAAFHADGQAVREQLEAAAARGETGYIQVHHSTVDASAKRAKSWEEIAPLMAAQSAELQEKVASLGLTPEEESLLRAADLWVRRFARERSRGDEANSYSADRGQSRQAGVVAGTGCPVCGSAELTAKPYATWPPPAELALSPPYEDLLGRPSYEVCPNCGYEFGNDDNPGTASPVSFEEYRDEWEKRGPPRFRR